MTRTHAAFGSATIVMLGLALAFTAGRHESVSYDPASLEKHGVEIKPISFAESEITQGGTCYDCVLEDAVFMSALGGCLDVSTGLVWGQISWPMSFNWEDGNAWAESLVHCGFDDWRLPTLEEMEQVYANGATSHFDRSLGLNGSYWSSKRTGNWAWRMKLLLDGDVKRLWHPSSLMLVIPVRDAVAPPTPGGCNNDGICDPGEDCESCDDCEGRTTGPPSGRYCCGNGVLEGPEDANDDGVLDDGMCDGNQ